MIHNDQISSIQELLGKDNSFTVHHFNIQSLAISMFKVINIIATIMFISLPYQDNRVIPGKFIKSMSSQKFKILEIFTI